MADAVRARETPNDGDAQGRLEVRGLAKQFHDPGSRQEKTVFESVDLIVEPGEFVSVVGASGCGKTTFIRVIHGLIDRSAGTVTLGGRAVGPPDYARGFVFQGDSLLPWRTVRDNIALGLELQGVAKRERRRRADELARKMGLAGYERYYPHQISGGMRQRVNLARAFAIDPQVLLMDEPFAALDVETRESMQAELLRIWAENRRTVVFITHQIEEAVYLSDRIVLFGHQPSRVARVFDIDLARPRMLEMKRAPEFHEKVDTIWAALSETRATEES